MIISCQNIFKTYKSQEKPVLNNVSLQLARGSFSAIVGRSGCGKSTLLKILCSLLPPDSGNVSVLGKDILLLNAKEKSQFLSTDVGIVFQDNNLVDDFTIEENILTPSYIAGKSVDKDYFLELVKLAEMQEHLKKYPSQLSGGQRQKAAVIRAFILKPQIVFADEPTGSVDSVSEKQIMDMFLNFNKNFNTTIVMVTHSKNCMSVASEVISLKEGTIETREKFAGEM